jgi:hypothetical protein
MPDQKHKSEVVDVRSNDHPLVPSVSGTRLCSNCREARSFCDIRREQIMLVIKGMLFVFGLFLLALIAVAVIARGGMFAVQYVTQFGMFLLGVGLGTTVIGCGLMYLGKIALAHLNRVAQRRRVYLESLPSVGK